MATFEKRATTILDEKVNVVLTYRELLCLYAFASECPDIEAATVYNSFDLDGYIVADRIELTDDIFEFINESGFQSNGGNV